MAVLLFALLCLCSQRETETVQRTAGHSPQEYSELFNSFADHFGKKYATPQEKATRLGFFAKRVSKLLVSTIAVSDQVFFAGVPHGQPVPLRYSLVKYSCDKHYQLRDYMDLSDEEIDKKYLVKLGITQEDLRQSRERMKQRFPEAAGYIDKVGEKGGNFHDELAKATRAQRQPSEGKKAAGWSKLKFLSQILPQAPRRPSAVPPPITNTCPPRNGGSEVKTRLLLRENVRSPDEVYVNGENTPDFMIYESYAPGIKKQSDNCRACYALAAVDAITISYNIQEDSDKDFSTQEIIDCSSENGCENGNFHTVYNYVYWKGLSSARSYPNAGMAQACNPNPRRHSIELGLTALYPTVFSVLKALKTGPVIFPLQVSNKFDAFVSQEIFRGEDCNAYGYKPGGEHAVVIIGYQIIQRDYYLVARNSWGEEWGDQGTFKFIIPTLSHDTYLPCSIQGYYAYQFIAYKRRMNNNVLHNEKHKRRHHKKHL